MTDAARAARIEELTEFIKTLKQTMAETEDRETFKWLEGGVTKAEKELRCLHNSPCSSRVEE